MSILQGTSKNNEATRTIAEFIAVGLLSAYQLHGYVHLIIFLDLLRPPGNFQSKTHLFPT
jgi:hypothetical protein